MILFVFKVQGKLHINKFLFHFDSVSSSGVQNAAGESWLPESRFTVYMQAQAHQTLNDLRTTLHNTMQKQIEVPKQNRMQTKSWATVWLRVSKAPDLVTKFSSQKELPRMDMIISNNATVYTTAGTHICFQIHSLFTFPHKLWNKANVSKAKFNRHSALIPV